MTNKADFCRCILLIGILFICGLTSCKQPPVERIPQYVPKIETERKAGSLLITMSNPIAAPLQFIASSRDTIVQNVLAESFPLVVSGYTDSTFVLISDYLPESLKFNFSTLIGNPDAPFSPPVLELPFPKGTSYKVLQGYHGTFSHSSDYSRYAIDFDMAVGDTISAAAYGYVVGVVDGYKHGGNSQKWRDFANFITLYHPESGALTQYVHLVHKGSLVSLGDTVQVGQPVALSGNTGFSSQPHLHFNVLRPMLGKVVSTPVKSIGTYSGEELKEGVIAKN
jgi:murein DD-endopeptidase MepM/ murein hydrolase activator NlpD